MMTGELLWIRNIQSALKRQEYPGNSNRPPSDASFEANNWIAKRVRTGPADASHWARRVAGNRLLDPSEITRENLFPLSLAYHFSIL